MHITVAPDLRAYMHKKGYSAITLGLAESSTCCSGYACVATGFATPKGEAALEGKVRARLDADGVNVLVVARGLEFDDEVTFALKSFLGAKDIEARGVRAFSL